MNPDTAHHLKPNFLQQSGANTFGDMSSDPF